MNDQDVAYASANLEFARKLAAIRSSRLSSDVELSCLQKLGELEQAARKTGLHTISRSCAECTDPVVIGEYLRLFIR